MKDDNKRLISAVHVGKNQLGMDDDTYRSLLKQVTGKTSTLKMSLWELKKVLEAMKSKGFKYKKTSTRRQSPPSRGATVDKLRAIWITMHQHGFIKDGSEAALDAYVRRQTKSENNGQGIAAAAWLQGELCDKVLESLKQWHRREMATALVDKGITELNGHRKNWATAKAPYAYVSAAYEGQRL